MSFRANDCQQLSIFDSFLGLTAREQKALKRSWAKVFADEIFPEIDEQRFSVLYSDKDSLPNTPVNVIIGALIIKELFDLSDDDMVENLMLDSRYQYAQNIHSDSQFLKEYLSSQKEQEEKVTLITDGAYSGEENQALAEEKNIDLVTTDLTGRKAPDIYADFEFNDQGTRITQCPAGHTPKSSSYMSSNKQCRASFDRSLCASCPNKDRCRAKIHKRTAVVMISKGASERAKQQRRMQTDEFRQLARIRNGVETLPSILRNRYHVDNMFVRGLKRTKFFFGSKIGALNFRKLFRYRKGLGHYAQNPAIV